MDGKPSACAELPSGRMPAGPVTVAYRAVVYHCGIDETITPDDTGHKYEHDYSICHSDRRMDDFGIELSPARKNRKLYEICFQTAAMTMSSIA